MKTAKTWEESFKVEEKYEDQPYCWIQWKGTDVCMDFHCECGFMGHIDGSFTYIVECPKCHSVYSCNGHIELIKLEEKPDGNIHVVNDDLMD